MNRLFRFHSELKRRNVFRAGAAYLVLAWLAIQIADIILDAFETPDWILRTLIVSLSLGFPITVVLSWVYEITVEGVKRTEDVLPNESITDRTGRRLDFIVIGLLSVAVAVFAIDRFIWRQFEDQGVDPSYEYSLAVLPFDIGSNHIAPLFAQLSSEISRALSRNNQIRLASIDSVGALPEGIQFTEIATRLGVRYLVNGIIEIDDANLGLSVSLFDNDLGKETWTSQFSGAHTQQTTFRISEKIIDEIEADPLSLPIRTVDPRAYETYLRARQLDAASDEPDDEAEKVYREALSLDARFADALAGLCQLLSRRYAKLQTTTDFEEAERLCYRAWTLDRQSVEVQVALGWLYVDSGQMENARESFVAAISINPNNLDARLGLARTHYQEQSDLAEGQLKQLIEQHPGSPNAYFALQHLLFTQGRYPEAVEQARWAVRLLPGDAGAKDRLIGDLLYAGMFDEAKSVVQQQIKDASGYFAEKALGHLGLLLFFEGDYEGAAKLWRNRIKQNPNVSVMHRNLGDAIWHLDGQEAAEPIFRKVIELSQKHLEIDPSDYYVLGDLVVAYASVGDSANFQNSLEALLNLGATDPQPHYEMAVSASRLGDMVAARQHAARAKELRYPLAWLEADPDISASGASFD